EGRGRVFAAAIPAPGMLPDRRILHVLAARMGTDLAVPRVADARAEIAALGTRGGAGPRPAEVARGADVGESAIPHEASGQDAQQSEVSAASATAALWMAPAATAEGQAVLASWRMLLDAGRMQDGRPNLAATARRPVARMCAVTAGEIGAADGDPVTVTGEGGSLTLPLAVTAMPERTVWVPMNAPARGLYPVLGAEPGAVVGVRAGGERP